MPAQHGLGYQRGRYGWQWTDDPYERARDLATVRGWLSGTSPAAMIHRTAAPWGQVPIEAAPVILEPGERAQYDTEWGEFCDEMRLARRGNNTARGRAALLRFRQKAGLIRVRATTEWVIAQLEADRQVAVSTEFADTAAEPIREAPRGLRDPCSLPCTAVTVSTPSQNGCGSNPGKLPWSCSPSRPP